MDDICREELTEIVQVMKMKIVTVIDGINTERMEIYGVNLISPFTTENK